MSTATNYECLIAPNDEGVNLAKGVPLPDKHQGICPDKCSPGKKKTCLAYPLFEKRKDNTFFFYGFPLRQTGLFI